MVYADPASLTALGVCFILFSTALVGLRIWARRIQKAKLDLDDFFVIASWLLFMILVIMMLAAVGQQLWGVNLVPWPIVNGKPVTTGEFSAAWQQSQKLYFVHDSLLPWQLMCAKLSILFFYRRTFIIESTGLFYWSVWSTIVAVALWGPCSFIIYTLRCGSHPSAVWTGPAKLQLEYCLHSPNSRIAMLGFDMVFDLIILVLPIRKILGLHMPAPKKALVAFVFALGASALVASTIRFALDVASTTDIQYFETIGPNRLVAIEVFVNILEAGFSVAAACVPSVNALIRKASVSLSERLSSFASSRRGSGDRATGQESQGKMGSYVNMDKMEKARQASASSSMA